MLVLKNKFIKHYNGHMILGFSCKLNFGGEKKITVHHTIDCKSSNIFFIKHTLAYWHTLMFSQVMLPNPFNMLEIKFYIPPPLP